MGYVAFATFYAMNTNPIMDKLYPATSPKCQELPEILDNYWTSTYSRDFHTSVRCWASEVSALGLSTALPSAQKTSEFSVLIMRSVKANLPN